MIDAYRIDGHTPSLAHPYRVKVDGRLLMNKKGEVRKFTTLLNALSFAQRYLEKKVRNGK